MSPQPWPLSLIWRLKNFPKGTGRAHDTAVLCDWLDHELRALTPGDVDSWYLHSAVFFKKNKFFVCSFVMFYFLSVGNMGATCA